MVLPRSMRIKGYKSFEYIHKTGIKYNSTSMLIKVAVSNSHLIREKSFQKKNINTCRCAISISNKVSKKAVIRNRLRRLFHEHLKLRLLKSATLQNHWILISLRPNALDKRSKNLLEEVDQLLHKAELKNA
ncbi:MULTISPECIES: ribonuclease P protein component [Prochlorococcus]|uniref:ribonuclease P protein component n=1 Tax=Prochlorococcus TaxID=1218 RepID=UPI000533B5A2|nr:MULTISPECIES: ribonuclease P protein component [Prochlorococcus]KGG12059.1 Ribonuclease P protein component [Prochlorococcus sp. MIT 0601]